MSEDIDVQWIRVKARWVMSYTMLALGRVHEVPPIKTRASLGVPAFIVGAGPSLRINGDLLHAASLRGLVLAVNASSPCCEHYNVTPDVVVARESIDMADQLAACRAPVIALDVSAHPSSWEAAGDRARWFIPSYPRHYEICRRLDVAPIEGGSSAVCTAVSLAREWGCDPIVLVGIDCAMASDGATYHPAAPRGAQIGKLIEGGQRVEFSSNEQDEARHERSGQRAHGRESAVELCAGWGGGPDVHTIATWIDQGDWLGISAQRWGSRPKALINATEGGIEIPGWEAKRLRETIDAMPIIYTDDVRATGLFAHEQITGAPVSKVKAQACIETMLRECDRMHFVAEEMLRPRPSLANLVHGGLMEMPELVEALASPELLNARLNHEPGPKRTRAHAEALRQAAEAARELLTAALGEEVV
jgi:hypothetical protein